MKLSGQIALVTGSSRGIGRAIAITFAQAGADLVVNFVKNRDAAEEVRNAIVSLGKSCLIVQADIANASHVNTLVKRAMEEYGRIDILVNNAGVIGLAPFLEVSEKQWDRIVDTNLKGYFLCGQAVAREMARLKRGKIINISSTGERFVAKGRAPYCVSKSAVNMLTKVMAVELAEYGINVNAIAPGLTDTDINRPLIRDEFLLNERLKHIPLHRVAKPEEIAKVALFLASDDANFITGETVWVDGGDSLQLDIIKRK